MLFSEFGLWDFSPLLGDILNIFTVHIPTLVINFFVAVATSIVKLLCVRCIIVLKSADNPKDP
jgi:hypothetical protein